MIYLITYNINTTYNDYTPLYEAIKQMGYSYKHPQETTWFIATRKPIDTNRMTQELKQFLWKGDTVFIAELHPQNNVQGWLSLDFWDWYKNNIS